MRDGVGGPEVLLLRKSARQRRFGSLWVFPGGGIDASDHITHADGNLNVLATAAAAAVREAREEAQLEVQRESLAFISHWLPPANEAARLERKYSTFFFAAAVPDSTSSAPVVRVDGSEIAEHMWLRPADALDRHSNCELPLLPPTWVTLEALRLCDTPSAAATVELVQRAQPASYVTRAVRQADGSTIFSFDGGDFGSSLDALTPSKLRLVSTPAAGDGSKSILRRERVARGRNATPCLADSLTSASVDPVHLTARR